MNDNRQALFFLVFLTSFGLLQYGLHADEAKPVKYSVAVEYDKKSDKTKLTLVLPEKVSKEAEKTIKEHAKQKFGQDIKIAEADDGTTTLFLSSGWGGNAYRQRPRYRNSREMKAALRVREERAIREADRISDERKRMKEFNRAEKKRKTEEKRVKNVNKKMMDIVNQTTIDAKIQASTQKALADAYGVAGRVMANEATRKALEEAKRNTAQAPKP